MFQLKHRGLFAKDGEVFPHASNCISQPKTAVGLAPALPGKNRSIVFFTQCILPANGPYSSSARS